MENQKQKLPDSFKWNENEIIVFQFKNRDKRKIYHFTKKNDLHISLLSNELMLVGIYIPPKKVKDNKVILDNSVKRNLYNMLHDLITNSIEYHCKVYECTERDSYIKKKG